MIPFNSPLGEGIALAPVAESDATSAPLVQAPAPPRCQTGYRADPRLPARCHPPAPGPPLPDRPGRSLSEELPTGFENRYKKQPTPKKDHNMLIYQNNQTDFRISFVPTSNSLSIQSCSWTLLRSNSSASRRYRLTVFDTELILSRKSALTSVMMCR